MGTGLGPCFFASPFLCHYVPPKVEGLCLEETSPEGEGTDSCFGEAKQEGRWAHPHSIILY